MQALPYRWAAAVSGKHIGGADLQGWGQGMAAFAVCDGL